MDCLEEQQELVASPVDEVEDIDDDQDSGCSCSSREIVDNNKRERITFMGTHGSLNSVSETETVESISSMDDVDSQSTNTVPPSSSHHHTRQHYNLGSVPCLQQMHNPTICGCTTCRTRSANDLPTLTLRSTRSSGMSRSGPGQSSANQRKRSGAISAKSKSSYLQQYKRRKEEYFRNRIDSAVSNSSHQVLGLGGEPVLTTVNMNRWSTYK